MQRLTSARHSNGGATPGERKLLEPGYGDVRNLSERLTSTPLRCPVAPESEELGIPVRQLIDGRYRILFIVEKKTVTILHLKGAYVAGFKRL